MGRSKDWHLLTVEAPCVDRLHLLPQIAPQIAAGKLRSRRSRLAPVHSCHKAWLLLPLGPWACHSTLQEAWFPHLSKEGWAAEGPEEGRDGAGGGNSGAQAGGQGASSHLDGPPNGPGYAVCSFPTCSQNSLSPAKGWGTRRDSCAESKSQDSTLQQEATRHRAWNSGVGMTCGPSLWAQDPGKQLPTSQSLGETGI